MNEQWWVQRWLELLDSYRFKKRLERARIYAREGNVLNIEFNQTQVLAQVQGSEAQPYQVSLALDSFTEESWQDIINTLSEHALFLAQLLAGEMPQDIEGVFTANGLSLFPFNLSEIHSHCTCPDAANPCKHIGAVYYQLADRFSENPFVIFQLRGKSKTEIILALRQLRAQELGEPENLTRENQLKQSKKALKESVELDFSQFWSYQEPLDSSLVVITPPESSKTPLDILGNLPLPYSEAQLVEAYLKQIYSDLLSKREKY
ncbi:MAG: hypothetical protein EA365_00350 [Gloeocapsa sp. DLM2.Bin57]|nr:MAG: hypothetical protein EA365_00350 [Gloeocapsa sp. DLM2.Bin57]